ncbi:ABC transporter ATP-binding protein [Ralstonia mojiangensis]|uniref:ABC transporter ATP-binding protein n=1 Tax=Ralstonia mojiangensis TaxID=2953895 RepID=A0AAE3I4R8_9RALS|nr:ABC transporter ATP-binding protein [Ralstonia mojiangensis]MCO5413820.1 ABC transporter ATP-binding protein [Ralstonia mojiangensis]MCT7317679.1 ABC transporter ATP-binding protein [Ralstonia mojiangensis]
MSFLRLNHVSKQYGDLRVVQDFNLNVHKGEFVSLLGPSGCGKTTTLQMIAGFAEVTEGSIELDGKDITRAKANARGLGIVFQTYALFPHMTVRENVEFGLEMRKCPAAERRERAMQTLALVHLDKHIDRYPRELSGGQRQRVALARALVIKPPVLLLDEPLSNLDAKLREEMQFELREIQRKVGTTTIMVTHDQAEAMSISDRVVVMEAGRITQVDTPLAVYEHPRNAFISTFVGKANLLHAAVVSGANGELRASVGAVELALPPGTPAGSKVVLALRPEKMTCNADGTGRCEGRVTERFFLGNQWMYTVDTPLGAMLVSAVNDGDAPRDVGQTVGVDWEDRYVRVIGSEGTAA